MAEAAKPATPRARPSSRAKTAPAAVKTDAETTESTEGAKTVVELEIEGETKNFLKWSSPDVKGGIYTDRDVTSVKVLIVSE